MHKLLIGGRNSKGGSTSFTRERERERKLAVETTTLASFLVNSLNCSRGVRQRELFQLYVNSTKREVTTRMFSHKHREGDGLDNTERN